MNAIDLAIHLGRGEYDWIPEAMEMLNKQHDRIAELEKEKQEQALQLLSDFTCIAELEKDLHMIQRHNDQLDNDIYTVCLDCNKKVTSDSIHTCSPQTKPLSDEEIVCNHGYNLKKLCCPKCEAGIEERILGK